MIPLIAAAVLNPAAAAALVNKIRKTKHRSYLHQHNGGDPITVKTTQSRNKLCACKSGKKHKNCCLLRPPLEQVADVVMAEKVESRLQGDV